MGYYARTMETNFRIEADKIGEANAALAEFERLFPEEHSDHFYNEVSNVEEALLELGFDVDWEDGVLVMNCFDAKWRTQERVLNIWKDVVAADTYINFIGEDGEMWRWEPSGIKNAVISWV